MLAGGDGNFDPAARVASMGRGPPRSSRRPLVGGYVEAGRRATAAVHAAIREASRRLGRPITTRTVTVRLLPAVEVTVTGLTGGRRTGIRFARGAPGGGVGPRGGGPRPAPPLGRARRRGGGRRGARAQGHGGDPPGRPPLARTSAGALPRRLARRARCAASRIGRASVTHGTLRVVDLSDGRAETATVEPIDAVVTGLGPDRGATAIVTAGLFGAARNSRTTVSLGRLRVGGRGDPVAPAVGRVEFALDGVVLAPALRVAAKHRRLRLLAGTLGGTASLALGPDGRPSRHRRPARSTGSCCSAARAASAPPWRRAPTRTWPSTPRTTSWTSPAWP